MDNSETIEILLFEDNPGDAGLIEIMLEEFNDFSYKLKNAETLNEGMDLLEANSFDIILLDLGLPDSDGIETFVEVNKKCHETPIIILTGLTDEKTGINAVKRGAQDYLVKGQVESKLLERSIKYSIERKKTEEKIQIFANIVESSEDAIITKSLDGNITGWNRGAEQIYGYPAIEIIGKSISILESDNLKGETERLIERIKNGNRIKNYETLRLKRDSNIINVSITLSPVFDSYGELVAISTIARDITEKKMAEQKLKKIIEELERSNDELRQFAYITSHDLQEPLRTIASYTQLIERRYKNKLDDDADDFLDFIVKAAVRMKDMIQGLLYYSRVGTRGEELRSISTEELLEIVLSNLKAAIEENDVTVTHDELPVIVADGGQLIQLFQNLISNGIKFKKNNEYPKIHISARKGENEHIFSVADNGIGIEPQYFNRIFEVFKRLHTSVEYEGTGIGLSISKRIIERHGGRMWVESEAGNGSIFYFTIPFAQ
jgi:PAS domain S-box